MPASAMKAVSIKCKDPRSPLFSLLSERLARKLFERGGAGVSMALMKTVMDTAQISREVETCRKDSKTEYSHDLHMMELIKADSLHDLFRAVEKVWAAKIMSVEVDGGSLFSSTEHCRKVFGKALCYICLSRGGLTSEEVWKVLGDKNGSICNALKTATAGILKVS